VVKPAATLIALRPWVLSLKLRCVAIDGPARCRAPSFWVLGSPGAENSGKAFSFVDSSEPSGIKLIRGQHHGDLRQRLQRELELIARLRTANVRFIDAQTERIWAIVSAHQAGLSIRKIADVTGLSSSRIHQLLNAPEAKEIPAWLSQLRQSTGGFAPKNEAERPELESKIQVEALRRCIDWLQRLERGENVIVNLRLDTDVETEFVSFDGPRVVRVLERIAADLDKLSEVPNDPQAEREANQHDPQARHRRELAEPSPEPKKLKSPTGADGVASGKLNALALFSVPLLPNTQVGRHREG
jgi:hypothetical protein